MLESKRWRFFVKVAVVVLAVAMIAPTALAFGSSGIDVAKAGGNGHGRGHAKGGAPRFSDVSTSDWAYGDIELMAAKGLMAGYGKGRFGPKNHVTRLELVLLATRLFGHEEDAQEQPPADVSDTLDDSFTDSSDVPNWAGARESLAYAIDESYLWPLLMSGSASFRPNAPAKRVEVIVVLLEGAGFGAQAQALADAPIAFADASAIPSWAWGYVALGVELGLVRGSGGVLQPNKPVIRAEMAALLHRLDEIIETGGDEDVVRGEVVSVTVPTDTTQPTTITVKTSTGDETYPLVSGVVVMNGGKQATLADVKPGLSVALYLNQDGQVLLIDIAAPAPSTSVTGMILATTLASDGKLASITLWVNNESKLYTAADTVTITKDGQAGTVADLITGITVKLTLGSDGKVTAATIGAEAPQTTEVTGMILATTLTSDGKLATLTLWANNESKVYTAAATVAITKDGQAGTVADLVNGITAKLTLGSDGKITAVAVGTTPPQVTEVTGMILGTTLGSDGKLTSITLWVNNEAKVYTAAATVAITKNGEAGVVGDLTVGLTVKLTLTDGKVTAIAIGTPPPQTTEVTGMILGTTLDSAGKLASLTLWLGSEAKVYAAATEVTITKNGQAATVADLTAGITVKLTLTDGKITAAAIGDPNAEVSTVEGTVTRVTAGSGSTASSISLIPDDVNPPAERTYDLVSAATVKVNGQTATLADVKAGDSVVVHLNAQNQVLALEATYVITQESGTVLAVALDASNKLVTLTVRVGEADKTYAASADAEVIYNGVEVPATELAIGDTVTVAVARGYLFQVTITAKASQG